jgi:putative transposase
MLKVFNLKKSTYYYTLNAMNNDKDADLKQEILAIFQENKSRYGYRRVTLELKNRGINVNHKKVKRIMKILSLYGLTPKAKYKSYKGDMNGTCKNLLLDKEVDEENHKTKYVRNFFTTSINQKWTTDVSEFAIAAGKLYLSPILDMYNDEIISFDISTSANYAQIKRMLDGAFQKFDDLTGLIYHSDQGWQYQMQAYHKALADRGIKQSMSRKGNCMDNGIMEQFFGKMKNEMFYGHEQEFKTLDQLKQAMTEYIDYYNNQRISEKLKGLTPCQAREKALLCK